MTKENTQKDLKQIIDKFVVNKFIFSNLFCNIFYFCNHHAIKWDIYIY